MRIPLNWHYGADGFGAFPLGIDYGDGIAGSMYIER